MTQDTQNSSQNESSGKSPEQIESLRDLIPHLRDLHASVNAPNVFQSWLEELIAAKNKH